MKFITYDNGGSHSDIYVYIYDGHVDHLHYADVLVGIFC
jgi:hypothetical protein